MSKEYLKIEDQNSVDFPFYNNEPIKIPIFKWIIWFVITILSYFLFTGYGLKPIFEALDVKSHPDLLPFFIAAVLLITIAILLITTNVITKGNLNQIFRKLNKKEVRFSILLGLISLVVMGLYTKFIVEDTLHIKTVADSALSNLKSSDSGMSIFTLVEVVIQLICEELWTIIPFLSVLAFSTQVLKVSRKTAIILAWILSSIIFGLYHLPSYDYNLLQVLILIAPIRLILTIAYIRYKNIWASYIVHLSYDLPIILLTMLMSIINHTQ